MAVGDPVVTARLARQGWRDWEPGDGTCYRVRLITVVGGPDDGDLILLVSVLGSAWSIQVPIVGYRIRQAGGEFTADRVKALGVPAAMCAAVSPLLAAIRKAHVQ